MNFVEPIRDRKKIAQIKNLLRGQERFRDLLLFVVGINTALRISVLLQLQVLHFIDEQGHIRQRFWIKEQKRGKRQEVVVNESIREAATGRSVGGARCSMVCSAPSPAVAGCLREHAWGWLGVGCSVADDHSGARADR